MMTPQTSRPTNRWKRGFTLIEMSMAMTLSITIGAIMITLLQQQISFHRITRAQNFLVQEAPQISNIVTQILNRGDAYRIHVDLTDAISNAGAVESGGKVLVIGFNNPDNTQEFGMIAYELIDDEPVLGYYNLSAAGNFAGAGNPDWIISRQVENVVFFVQNGFFRLQLTGPAGESITYSRTPRL